MSLLSISSLSFAFRSAPVPLFDRLNLEVAAGEMLCVLGPSGCGKSTLLNLIAGFLRPTGGRIELHGKRGAACRMGYIFQDDALLPWRTIRANISLASELDHMQRHGMEDEIHKQLASFNLDPSILGRYPGELSGGMRQRIALIQSLMAKPDLLLLDEPFSAVDFLTKLKLESDVKRLVSRESLTAIFVTHDIDEAIAIADRIVVLGRNPQGMVADIRTDIDVDGTLSPEEVRTHPSFGDRYAQVRKVMRDEF